MPSRDDVARLAGVSGATVSYVLNGKSRQSISARTRERVLAAAAQLNYQPSQAARAMVRGRYDQVGLLMPPGDMSRHWYHQGILHGAWSEVMKHGVRLVIDAVVPGRELSFIQERFVDGLIAPGTGPDTLTDDIRDRLGTLQIPVVVIGSGSWSQEFHTVDVDNQEVGRTAARHLIEHGHRRFIYFGGESGFNSTERRRSGVREVLAEAGLSLPDDHIFDSGVEPEPALARARQVLAQPLDATAAICYNDSTAMAIWTVALERGLRVPEDLSIIGVDANPTAGHERLRLASIRQPLSDMGARAVRLVISPPKRPQHDILPIALQVGDTVAPPA